MSSLPVTDQWEHGRNESDGSDWHGQGDCNNRVGLVNMLVSGRPRLNNLAREIKDIYIIRYRKFKLTCPDKLSIPNVPVFDN